MIAEFIGIKNCEIVRRFKEECSQVDYDEDTILIGVRGYSIKDLSSMYDRIKLIVDNEEWLNKSFVNIDFSSYELNKEYEFSDNLKNWTKMTLVAINEENELPFEARNSGLIIFAWRYCREVI